MSPNNVTKRGPRWIASSLMLTLLLPGCANPWLLLKPLPRETLNAPASSSLPKGDYLLNVDQKLDGWAKQLNDLQKKTEPSEPGSSN